MHKLAARLFFCSGPAILFGLAAGLASRSIALAMLVAVVMLGFGLHITADDGTKEGRKDE